MWKRGEATSRLLTMCGRYNLNATPRLLIRHYRFALFPRYNIAPTQTVVIVRQNAATKHGTGLG